MNHWHCFVMDLILKEVGGEGHSGRSLFVILGTYLQSPTVWWIYYDAVWMKALSTPGLSKLMHEYCIVLQPTPAIRGRMDRQQWLAQSWCIAQWCIRMHLGRRNVSMAYCRSYLSSGVKWCGKNSGKCMSQCVSRKYNIPLQAKYTITNSW